MINRLKKSFRALANKNYRLFFFGQGCSLIGTWMQNIALAWLVYRLTHSVFLLGLVSFLSQIMIFVLSPFAGVITERVNRKHLLIITQVLSMFQAFVLAALIYTNLITVWQIILLSLFLGTVVAFDATARQSFVIQTVNHKKDLSNAIALNSSAFQVARLIGPGLAGIIINIWGEGFCILLNAVSYLAIIGSLILIKIKHQKQKKIQVKILSELKEGFSYAYNFLPIRYILLLIAAFSLIGMQYTVLMPAYAEDILHKGPETLGLLMCAAGLGAFLGAAYMATRKNVRGLSKIIAVATIIFSISLFILAFIKTLWLAALFIGVSGFGMMLVMASCNTMLQTLVDDDKRSRIMSIYTMAFLGMSPFGSLIAGCFANYFKVPLTLFFSGLICFLFSLIFLFYLPKFRGLVRPVYIKLGIIPEINQAINMACELKEISKEE
ncbi:MAG: MFS transporter [Candidatus Margulisiibacteriota bacterium]|jgi:MFS family permease